MVGRVLRAAPGKIDAIISTGISRSSARNVPSRAAVFDDGVPVHQDASPNAAGPMTEQSCAESPLVTFASDGAPIPQAAVPDF
jgi:hypothetical protein